MAMATRMAGQGEILALDLHGDRLATVRENLARMKLAGLVHALEADATRRESVVGVCGDQPFDRVLLDVPCTNTGVIRRRPDARWRFSMARLKKINGVQRRILEAMAPLVKPGGRLVYSTCSLEPEEGEGMLAQWLGTHREFEMGDSSRLFPPDNGTDGIYAAACRRRD
jgi:16S rRNA (cytosine967-C5)-methyltransferase